MTIDQLTDIAYEIVNELEPGRSFDVFDVDGPHIIFETEHGLMRIRVDCIDGSVKEQIKRRLCE